MKSKISSALTISCVFLSKSVFEGKSLETSHCVVSVSSKFVALFQSPKLV